MSFQHVKPTCLCTLLASIVLLNSGCSGESPSPNQNTVGAVEQMQDKLDLPRQSSAPVEAHDAPASESSSPKLPSSVMQKFQIGDSDVGVNLAESSLVVDTENPGEPTVTIEIKADDAVFDTLTENEEYDFSWATYPPEFYFRDIPIEIDPDSKIGTATATLDDIDQYEFAVYMEAHHDVDDVRVTVSVDGTVDVSGVVEIDEKKYKLHIVFNPESAG